MTIPQITQQLAFEFGTPVLEAPAKAPVRLLATLTLTTSFGATRMSEPTSNDGGNSLDGEDADAVSSTL